MDQWGPLESQIGGESFAEYGLSGNAVGTNTNEFNCYHSSHFHR